MKENKWKVLLVLFVVFWALWEMYPPWDQSLVKEFNRSAANTDETFQEIVSEAKKLKEKSPEREFQHLMTAIGTNNIAGYFPNIVDKIDVPPDEDPTRHILYELQRQSSGEIKLGLDLQGGVSFLVGVDTNKVAGANRQVLAQAISVLRKRVDSFGVAQPMIQQAGNNQILIQLPGLSQSRKEDARTTIQKAATLKFSLVHPESQKFLKEGIVPPGYVKKKMTRRNDAGEQTVLTYLVKEDAARGLTGKYLSEASVQLDPATGQPSISLEFNSEGADIFEAITEENTGDQLAILLDGELYSAPTIQTVIAGGTAQITGDFTREEASNLASILTNPLEAEVKILQERSVDPTLGQDSIKSGVRACLVGLIVVAIFMLIYYFLAGLVANVALVLNLIFLLGVLASVEATLTLPGIAGIVLTVGMAVDANVLIFERIREELRAGKSIRGAVSAGYDKAFGTIIDANITTLIASIILINLGTGPVKGFGVTLTVGIIASMVTALIVTRIIFDWFLEKGWLTSLRMLHLVGNTKIDFMRWWKPAFAASWGLIILTMVYAGTVRSGNLFGVDFAGGDTVTLDFKQGNKPSVGEIRSGLAEEGFQDVLIQYQTDLSNGEETLKITSEFDTANQVVEGLKSQFPSAGFQLEMTERVGPTVGKQIQRSAILSILLALFGILVYVAFRFEFSFAIGAVIAVLHDVLLTVGLFALVGGEFTAPMVAAILTIIGFSINDTIVIFDRIREDLQLGIRGSFKEVMNGALNRTLARTVITSGTTLLSTLALYIFGGVVIHDFAFTFLLGVLVGTYSSIYTASAIVLWWHKGQRPIAKTQATAPEPGASPAAA